MSKDHDLVALTVDGDHAHRCADPQQVANDAQLAAGRLRPKTWRACGMATRASNLKSVDQSERLPPPIEPQSSQPFCEHAPGYAKLATTMAPSVLTDKHGAGASIRTENGPPISACRYPKLGTPRC